MGAAAGLNPTGLLQDWPRGPRARLLFLGDTLGHLHCLFLGTQGKPSVVTHQVAPRSRGDLGGVGGGAHQLWCLGTSD